MAIADVDGDGSIDYNEFVAATMHVSKLEQEELLQRAFRQLDADGSGSISIDELAAALREFGIYEDAKVCCVVFCCLLLFFCVCAALPSMLPQPVNRLSLLT